MKPLWLAIALLLGIDTLHAATLTLTAPLDYQVIQRQANDSGVLTIAGKLADSDPKDVAIEVRIGQSGKESAWLNVPAKFTGQAFTAATDAPAGGWYTIDVRATSAGQTLAEAQVPHVGVGEVLIVAGQSNSANHGEEKQTTMTGKVAAFDGMRWQLANDPQPGASGDQGSFMPPLGDALAQRLKVPVGFVACGIGATSVREWLPKGQTFANPPTILSRVQKRSDGAWESDGQAFDMLVDRMKSLGPHSFRAVLWHQGESDANQSDATRTLPGKLYREYLETIIRDSRGAIGWDAPWIVAQASYHVPGDEGSAEIRAAQASLWKDGIALEGPDSDALKGKLREAGGAGVHFSGPGLREHASKWLEKIAPWIEKQ